MAILGANIMGEKLVTIGVAIVGVATLAVLVSRNANTANVLRAGGSAFSDALRAAVSPVTGGGANGYMNGFTAPF
jgi:hypothetical protein